MTTTICRLALGLASAITLTQAHAGFELTGSGPISLYQAAQRSSTFDGCKDLFPGGRPIPLTTVSADWMPRGLCSDSFAVLYSGRSKTPLVVVERLNRQQVPQDEKRMVVILPEVQHHDWLHAPHAHVAGFLQQYPADGMLASAAQRSSS
jgi:hypothetical protein